jgi:signal transduction histidine kinase
MIRSYWSESLVKTVSEHYDGITLSCLLLVITSIFFGEIIGNQSLWIIVSGILTIIATTGYFINFFSGDIVSLPKESNPKETSPETPADVKYLTQHKLRHLVLEKRDQTQAEFLSAIAQELRTPLNVITTYANFLLGHSVGNLTEEQKQMLVSVDRNALNMVNLINSVLEYARLESGRREIETFNFDDLLYDMASTLKQEAAQKGVTLDLNVQTGLPPLHSVRGAVVQVLGNLISNSIKFLEAGGSITVEATQSGRDPDQLEIRVKESGGREKDFRQIFDVFYHAQSEKVVGTGLGLSITKELVERLGGSLTIESQLKQTAVWKVEIPRDIEQ